MFSNNHDGGPLAPADGALGAGGTTGIGDAGTGDEDTANEEAGPRARHTANIVARAVAHLLQRHQNARQTRTHSFPFARTIRTLQLLSWVSPRLTISSPRRTRRYRPARRIVFAEPNLSTAMPKTHDAFTRTQPWRR